VVEFSSPGIVKTELMAGTDPLAAANDADPDGGALTPRSIAKRCGREDHLVLLPVAASRKAFDVVIKRSKTR
jgi:hypothetical protein